MQKELYHERDIIGLIQEHMVEGILILDDSDKIQLANRTATALLSIEKENWDNKSNLHPHRQPGISGCAAEVQNRAAARYAAG